MEDNKNMDVYEILSRYGYADGEIDKIINDKSSFGYDVNKLGTIIDNSYTYLSNKGYTYEEIKKMALSFPGVLSTSNGKRKIIEDVFLGLGMSFLEFKRISLKCVNIFSYSEERICSYINFFRNVGYLDKDIIKIFKIVPLIFRVSINNLEKFCNEMISYGFTKEEIFKIGKNFPSFWSHNFNKVNIIIDTFIVLGFSKEEVKKIIMLSPSLIGYNKETILEKFEDIMMLGFTREELMGVIRIYPTILSADVNRTREILDFFTKIGLREKILNDPKSFFMQGIESSYAKYYFYMDNDVEINDNTYRRLFLDWKRFENKYGIGKEELLEKYSYDADMKNIVKKK